MTNAEKFEEVFGIKISEYPADPCGIFDHHICIDNDCNKRCPAKGFWQKCYRKPKEKED